MEQYISKSALVAEIERRISNLDKLGNRLYIETNFPEQYRLIHGYESLLSFLDTIEVKEIGVDIGSPEGDIGVKTIWDGDKIVSNKAQKGEEV